MSQCIIGRYIRQIYERQQVTEVELRQKLKSVSSEWMWKSDRDEQIIIYMRNGINETYITDNLSFISTM